ncbi:sensor histidine kinase [Herpetosiphon giganteus]|uniref:GAF domain-containing sensor histidine kinase n=1 Tax=Herpetosiphon giganteus TaxID=2029754 RepID=UPI0019574583|nr:HAMP domain-containing sensor histidine kinase [Herpetosiphon giganteus]MBM7844615.1 signal transduction histidine kinase [Herpetosiphon giganteus]
MNQHDPDRAAEQEVLERLAMLSTMQFDDVDRAIQTYLAVACEVAGTKTALIGDLNRTHQYIRAIYPASTGNLAAGSILAREDTFCQYIDVTAQPLVVGDAASDQRVQPLLSRLETPIRAYLGVPIPASTAALTPTLCTFDPQAHRFTPVHVAALKLLAHQIARWMPELRAPATDEPPVALANMSVAELNQIVAHDIRNPLHFLQGTLELLQSEPALIPDPTLGSLLPQAYGSVLHIQRLVRDLVDATTLMTGSLSFVRHTIELGSLIEEITAVAKSTLNPRCSLVVAIEPDLPTLISDRDRVWQVLHNLISNAVRYTETGTITVRTRANNHQTIRIEIEDTGPGIDPVDIERIWERHARASSVAHGWGLGLAIVRSLVLALGGQVGVESTVGEGSCFWVVLPVVRTEPALVDYQPWRS